MPENTAESVLVPPARVERWVQNFQGRHGTTALTTRDGSLAGSASDGSTFTAAAPFGGRYLGLAEPAAFAAHARDAAPGQWGVLLVRKGGYGVARMSRARATATKVGSRHVQGRTKAGGQSQQRFARRRANQARVAYEAAAEHAVRLLGDLRGPLVTGGDKQAVAEVLEHPRLRHLEPVERWLAVAEPRRDVLLAAIESAQCVEISVHNSANEPWPGR
ncbi:acVLRF1 family peptidyl-tRNA hydrolase [Nocardioides acrostichi]|uniref:Actinobacteria/chloroflexi VLRF1 release factor domain-containing protein n=1 Tax=Nocardioides acrostichi TaxID=2784339 RepID=A0A930Y670_9ACTN|nr:acVLRF1 family peptidyl-tRNA hydrolase [Nocardioides acrostichi]MBF4162020.1 hypothetical protein [Nocardioides acrostichi]